MPTVRKIGDRVIVNWNGSSCDADETVTVLGGGPYREMQIVRSCDGAISHRINLLSISIEWNIYPCEIN